MGLNIRFRVNFNRAITGLQVPFGKVVGRFVTAADSGWLIVEVLACWYRGDRHGFGDVAANGGVFVEGESTES